MCISNKVTHLNDRYRVVYISTRMARALTLIVVFFRFDIHNPFVHLFLFPARKRLVAPIP